MLILNMGALLSPLLYSLFTHDCMARHDSNTIIKFADDTTVVGLITNNNETAYRRRSETWPCGARTTTSPSM
jgi:siderophore synthetase component